MKSQLALRMTYEIFVNNCSIRGKIIGFLNRVFPSLSFDGYEAESIKAIEMSTVHTLQFRDVCYSIFCEIGTESAILRPDVTEK